MKQESFGTTEFNPCEQDAGAFLAVEIVVRAIFWPLDHRSKGAESIFSWLD